MKLYSPALLACIMCWSTAEADSLRYGSISEVRSFRNGATISRYIK